MTVSTHRSDTITYSGGRRQDVGWVACEHITLLPFVASTYMLAWEAGIVMIISIALFETVYKSKCACTIVYIICSVMIMYQ